MTKIHDEIIRVSWRSKKGTRRKFSHTKSANCAERNHSRMSKPFDFAVTNARPSSLGSAYEAIDNWYQRRKIERTRARERTSRICATSISVTSKILAPLAMAATAAPPPLFIYLANAPTCNIWRRVARYFCRTALEANSFGEGRGRERESERMGTTRNEKQMSAKSTTSRWETMRSRKLSREIAYPMDRFRRHYPILRRGLEVDSAYIRAIRSSLSLPPA